MARLQYIPLKTFNEFIQDGDFAEMSYTINIALAAYEYDKRIAAELTGTTELTK